MSTILLLAQLTYAQSAECPDYAEQPVALQELEPHASRGALNSDEIACLEQRYGESSVQTTKDKISRVLMVNAYATDTTTWAQLVERHLQEVDRSDPDIAYLYAFYLFNSDKSRVDDALVWADLALERKDAWTGRVYVARVYALMQLRAMAALDRWRLANEQLVTGDGPADGVANLRNEAKTLAREWVDFTIVSKRNPEHAVSVCLSVASQEACGLDAGRDGAPESADEP